MWACAISLLVIVVPIGMIYGRTCLITFSTPVIITVTVGDKYSRVVSSCHCPRILPLSIQHVVWLDSCAGCCSVWPC